MPAPDGAGADAGAGLMGGAALIDGLVTIEFGHHAPEAMKPRESRDRFPNVERIGPEQSETASANGAGSDACARRRIVLEHDCQSIQTNQKQN